jgi:hypothetical protein
VTSFQVDPAALTAAASTFQSQVEPINAAATSAQQLTGTGSSAGREYGSQGEAYHSSLLTAIQALYTPMATKTTWVAGTLTATATDYEQRDHGNSATITESGTGA